MIHLYQINLLIVKDFIAKDRYWTALLKNGKP